MTSAANDVSADVVSMCGPSDTRSSDLHFFPDEPESRRDIPPQTADRSNLLLYGTNDWLTVSLHHIASYVRPDSYQKLAIRKSFTDLLTYLEQLLCTVFSSHRMSYAASMKLQSVTSCLPAMRYRRPFSGSATVLILHTSYWHSLPASSVQTTAELLFVRQSHTTFLWLFEATTFVGEWSCLNFRFVTDDRSRASSPQLIICKHVDDDVDADGDEENDDSDCSGICGPAGPAGRCSSSAVDLRAASRGSRPLSAGRSRPTGPGKRRSSKCVKLCVPAVLPQRLPTTQCTLLAPSAAALTTRRESPELSMHSCSPRINCLHAV